MKFPGNAMEVRKARVGEAQAIIDLHADTIRRVNARDYTEEQIERWIGHRRVEITQAMIIAGEYLVCVEGEQLLGIGSRNGDVISSLYVSADHQGQGAETALLQHMEAEATQEGYNELHADSTLTALTFYLHHGYEEVERKHLKNTMEVVSLRKTLSASIDQ